MTYDVGACIITFVVSAMPGNVGRKADSPVLRFDEKRKAHYIRLLGQGLRRMQAASIVKVDYGTVMRAKQNDPEFKRACEEAEYSLIDDVEDSLYAAARYDRNVRACEVILYNRASDRWKDKRALVIQPQMQGADIPIPDPLQARPEVADFRPSQSAMRAIPQSEAG